MVQNPQHDTVDGRAPNDEPIIDDSGRMDPTREEAIRALATINGETSPAAEVVETERKSILPPVLDDPRDGISKNFRANRGRDITENKEDLDIARVDPANQAALYGSDVIGIKEAAEATQEDAAAPPAPVQKSKFRVKIDGQERDVTQDELISSYQKNQTGDQRLAEATRLLNEAKTVRQTAPIAANDGEGAEQSSPDSTMQNQPASTPSGAKFDRQKVANAVEKIAFGTTDEGVEALGELLTSVAPQQPLDINSQVENVLANRDYQRLSKDTTSRFVEKYPTLATDDILQTVSGELMAREMVKDFVSAGISRDVIERTLPNRQAVKTFYDHIAVQRPDLVRPLDQLFEAASQDASFKALAGAKTVPITTNIDRSDRKAMVQQQPAHRTPVPLSQIQAAPASREQRNSDAVSRMRQSRGQSTAA